MMLKSKSLFSPVLALVIATVLTNPVFATEVELDPTDDAAIWEYWQDINYGTNTWAFVGYWSDGFADSLINFDSLSNYLGNTVNSATLELYVFDDWAVMPDNNYVYLVAGDWDESTITWDDSPGYITDISYYFGPPTLDDWLILDVTELVQSLLDETYPIYGFYITQTDTSECGYDFHTKEIGDPNYHPKLILDYEYLSTESASVGSIKAAYK